MFEFELLPNEMQLEVLKKTEFQTVQRMKRVSKNLKEFILRHNRYMRPIPIRQMLATSNSVDFALSNSQDVNILDPKDAKHFLHSATIDMFWLEVFDGDLEPISFANSLLPNTTKINCVKLGGSKMECDPLFLTRFLESKKCRNLIIEWRFTLPEDFFDKFPLDQLDGLTIGEQPARQIYNNINGSQLLKFKGTWLELGPNNVDINDISQLLQKWKDYKIKYIKQYNIVVSSDFNMELLSRKMKNMVRHSIPNTWAVYREDGDGKKEEIQLRYYYSTLFSKLPSIVIKQVN